MKLKQSPLNFNQKGITLYLAIFVIVIILAVGLGISSLLLVEIRLSGDVGAAILALYAADSGGEKALYEAKDTADPDCDSFTDNLNNGSNFTVLSQADPITGEITIRSDGDFQGSKRSIEMNFIPDVPCD